MYCKKCGNKISFDASFCPNCGNNTDLNENLTCPRCNNIISDKDLYCRTCGYDLSCTSNQEKILNEKSENGDSSIINVNNYTHLRPFKLMTNIVTLLCAVLFIIFTFLPIFSTSLNLENKIDLFNYLINQDVSSTFYYKGNEFNINSINIISSYKLLLVEQETAFTKTLLNHVGLYVYGLMCFVLALIVIFSIIMIVYSIISIIKKSFYNNIKIFVSLIFALSLSFFFGFDNPGIGLILLTILSFLLLAYYYIIEIVSKEKKFNIQHFIAKSILVSLLSLSIIFIGFGTFSNNEVFARISMDTHGFKSNILSQTIIQMVYITDPKYSSYITNIYVWLSSLSLFASIIGTVFLTYSLASLLASYSNLNIPSPIKKITIGVIFLLISLIMDITFANFVFKSDYALYISNLSPSEIDALKTSDLLNLRAFRILPTVYIAIATLIISCIYSFIAKKIIIKTTINSNYVNNRID